MIMTLTDVCKMFKITQKTVNEVQQEVTPKLPIEVTWNGEVVFKIVPKHWRNPMFPVH